MVYSVHLEQINDRSGLIRMASLFAFITIVSISLRVYVRRLTKVGFGVDDWLALSALVSPYAYPFSRPGYLSIKHVD